MNEENVKNVAKAMNLLGSAYRGNWNGFDGRTLKYQLEELTYWLSSDKMFSLEDWMHSAGITENGEWVY